MREIIQEYLSIVLLLTALADLFVVPALLIYGQHKIEQRLSNVEAEVSEIADYLLVDPDDDPSDDEDEPEQPSNVVAFGRKIA